MGTLEMHSAGPFRRANTHRLPAGISGDRERRNPSGEGQDDRNAERALAGDTRRTGLYVGRECCQVNSHEPSSYGADQGFCR